MTAYGTAIRRATLAAARLHSTLKLEQRVEDTNGRVDVFAAIAELEIPLLLRPLDGLLGAYITAPDKGVLVTTQRPLTVQRFTAAHELGHHQLDHSPSLDDESIIRRAPFAATRGVDLQEVEADAFAAAFLLPRWLIAWHCKRQNWTSQDFRRSEVVYQLGLRVGLSYAASCWTLARYNFIDQRLAENLTSVPPKKIKQQLLGSVEPDDYYGDVWAITERDDGAVVEGGPSDILVVRVREHSGSGYIWRLENADDLVVMDDQRENLDSDNSDGGLTTRYIVARAKDAALEKLVLSERRPWKAKDFLHDLSLNLRLDGAETSGWSRAERRIRLEAA